MFYRKPGTALGLFLHNYPYPAQRLNSDLDVRYRIRRLRGTSDWEGVKPCDEDIRIFTDFINPGPEANSKFGEALEEKLGYWWTINPDAFLILERHPKRGRPEVTCISIVLPITEDAVNLMLDRQRSVLGLTRGDFCLAKGFNRTPCSNLLIAAWYTAPRWFNKLDGYGAALMLRHLGLLWNPAVQPEMNLLFIPTHAPLRKMLTEDLKCTGWSQHPDMPTQTEMFIRQLPISLGSSDLKAAMKKFTSNVFEARSWPIE